MKEENRYFSKKVTLLNVFLTFCIVLLHAKTPERWGLPLDQTHKFIFWTHHFTLVAVPTFFFLSGILFYRNCTFENLEGKLRTRVRSLLVPYVVWNVFFVVVYSVLVHMPMIHQRMNAGDVLNSPYEIVYSIVNARYTVLWFVKDLMLFSAFSACVLMVIQNLKVALLAFLFCIVMAVGSEIGYEHPLQWLPSYLSGAILGKHFLYDKEGKYRIIKADGTEKNRMKTVALLCFFFVFLCVLSGYKDGVCTFVYRLCAPLIIWSLMDLCLNRFIKTHFVIKPWMKCMFFVFCIHHFILNVLQKIIVLTLPPTDLVLNLTFVFSALVVFVMSVSLALFLSRYKFYAYLSGGR